MTKANICWLAAVIDCEGSISLAKCTPRRKCRAAYHPTMTVVNTDKRLIQETQRRTGVGYIGRRKNQNSKKHKGGWYWTCRSTGCLKILPLLIPYLILKRERAQLLLQAIKIARLNTAVKGYGYDSKQAISNREIIDKIYLRMKSLNARGPSAVLDNEGKVG